MSEFETALRAEIRELRSQIQKKLSAGNALGSLPDLAAKLQAFNSDKSFVLSGGRTVVAADGLIDQVDCYGFFVGADVSLSALAIKTDANWSDPSGVYTSSVLTPRFYPIPFTAIQVEVGSLGWVEIYYN